MLSRPRYFRLAAVAVAIAALPYAAFAQDDQRTRDPAPVMSYHGAQWLERPTRVEEERPDDVIAYMDLKPGMTVVDLGCGTGYFARRMAPKLLPGGRVLGVDIQPEMLDIMMQLCQKEGIENVIPVLGGEKDPKLPRGGVDWIIMADVYHEFQYPEEMLAKMLESLKPDGRVCLLEYRAENFRQASHIKPEHRMSVANVLKEWNAGGFELIDLQQFLPSQHMFIFQRRPNRN
jgi:cyclopropane fatty-acyl-phospholipid synthase-like methyltransferase